MGSLYRRLAGYSKPPVSRNFPYKEPKRPSLVNVLSHKRRPGRRVGDLYLLTV